MSEPKDSLPDLLDIVSRELQTALEKCDGNLNQEQITAVIDDLRARRAFSTTPTILSPLSTLQTPFEVVLASRFLHLFANPDGRSLQDGGLSPRMLPGFFKVVRMMIGGAKYDQYEEQCLTIETKLREENPYVTSTNLKYKTALAILHGQEGRVNEMTI